MARRRYISTMISIDQEVNRLAAEYGDFAVLLYTWMIPHAEDDATITGEPEELMMLVVPGRRDKTADDVARAVEGMITLGLVSRMAGKDGKQLLQFPPETFYRYQTYIPEKKRAKVRTGAGGNTARQRKSTHNSDDQRSSAPTTEHQRRSAQNADDQRSSPQNAVSPSPSPSPSPAPVPVPPPNPPPSEEGGAASAEELPPDPMEPVTTFLFESFIPTATAYQVDRLAAWVEQDGMEPGLIVWAMEQALMHGQRKLSYVEGILRRCKDHGIMTRRAAEMAEAERLEAKGRDSPEAPVKLVTDREEYYAQLEREREEFERLKAERLAAEGG